jgi:alpha-beta hydrolase superfamily lysophospholipase
MSTAPLSRRAYLGAELPGDTEAFTRDGVRIAEVLDGSMAARAGMRAGDMLVSLAARTVHDLRTLAAALRDAGHGSSTEVAYLRDGVLHTAIVDVIALAREPATDYGDLAVTGARLRTLVTRADPPRAFVLVIQGIACESVEHPLDPDAPLAAFVADLTRAGYSTLRFDKRGVGDSDGGPCASSDFHTELADARAALAHARALAGELPLVGFGHSVGGIIAAQLASDTDALAVYGTPVMRWLDCLLDSTERQLALRGATADEVAHRLAAIRALAETGELNGRSAAYHEQLHALDLEAAWRAVTVPVLVLRGEHDWVVRADDQARIAELARGPTTLVDLPDLDHLFGHHADREASLRDYGIGRADPVLARATIAWLDRLRSHA